MILLNIHFCHSQTDFFQAIRDGNIELIESELKNNSSLINTPNSSNYTPLVIAVYSGQLGVVQSLLKHGAKIEIKSNQGTALHGAAYKGHLEICKLLLKNNAKVNTTDETGITPLMYATLLNHVELAKFLYKNGANPLLKDQEGNSASIYAKQLNLIELTSLYKTFKI